MLLGVIQPRESADAAPRTQLWDRLQSISGMAFHVHSNGEKLKR